MTDDYLAKPMTPRALTATLARVARGLAGIA
jgi:DNA-binding response OmpR family regulator